MLVVSGCISVKKLSPRPANPIKVNNNNIIIHNYYYVGMFNGIGVNL